MANILIVEDDTTFNQLLSGFLQKNGHHTVAAQTVKSALTAINQQNFQVILLDYRLPDGLGLEVLTASVALNPAPAVIVMTSFNDVRTAVKTIQAGAMDYITKPVNPDELLMTINASLNKKAEKSITKTKAVDFIKGESEASGKLYDFIDLVAPTNMSVIIQGESGTGKEHVARTIHQQSSRKNKPFVAIDCGALSKDLAASEFFGHVKGAFTGAINDKTGQFVLAKGGTLFLDEVGNLSYDIQVKLLRALQEEMIQPLGGTQTIKTDVRIITATNDDLLSSVANGDFREDLYHRLNEFKIHLPPLREREDDLKIFIKHFIAQSNTELRRNVQHLSPEVKKVLFSYDWPGNLRELKNVVKRMVLLSTSDTVQQSALPEEMLIQAKQMPASAPSGTDLKEVNRNNEKAMIIEALEKARFNKSKAARFLNIDRKTLYSKMDKYGIE